MTRPAGGWKEIFTFFSVTRARSYIWKSKAIFAK